MNVMSTAHTMVRGSRLRLAVIAVVAVSALAVAGWVPGQAVAAQATASAAAAAAPAPTASRGFVLSSGRYTNFDVPGATTKTVVGGSNDRGQLVGYYTQTGLLDDPNSPRRGYLLDRGRFVRIDFPDAVDTQTLGINNRGQVAGQYVDAAGGFHGFVWERGRYTTVDAPGAVGTFLTDINDRGQLLGGRGEPDGTVRGFVLERDLAKRLAEAMGGALTVDSVEGQGTTFTLELSPAMEPA
jgi:uncharacterized membrane protein